MPSTVTIEMPFEYHGFGCAGKSRRPKPLRIRGTVPAEISVLEGKDIDWTNVDVIRTLRDRHISRRALPVQVAVINRSAFFAVNSGGEIAGFQPANRASLDTAIQSVLDGAAPALYPTPCAVPDPYYGYDVAPRLKVTQETSVTGLEFSNRDEMANRIMTDAECLAFIDGTLFSNRHEPVFHGSTWQAKDLGGFKVGEEPILYGDTLLPARDAHGGAHLTLSGEAVMALSDRLTLDAKTQHHAEQLVRTFDSRYPSFEVMLIGVAQRFLRNHFRIQNGVSMIGQGSISVPDAPEYVDEAVFELRDLLRQASTDARIPMLPGNLEAQMIAALHTTWDAMLRWDGEPFAYRNESLTASLNPMLLDTVTAWHEHRCSPTSDTIPTQSLSR